MHNLRCVMGQRQNIAVTAGADHHWLCQVGSLVEGWSGDRTDHRGRIWQQKVSQDGWSFFLGREKRLGGRNEGFLFFVETRSLASFWPAPKLKGKRWNMELDPWQPQLQQVFGEFRCGKTQLCLSLGLVTLDRLDQRVVVSAQSCEQVIFLMKRKEGEILHQCGKWWYDILLWYVCQSSCCNIHLVWSPELFWGHTLCVACQLPISKGGGESKVPNPSYPKFHFQKLPFENCIIFREQCKNVMLKYVEICWNMLMASCFRWNVTKFWLKTKNLLFVFRWHSR